MINLDSQRVRGLPSNLFTRFLTPKVDLVSQMVRGLLSNLLTQLLTATWLIFDSQQVRSCLSNLPPQSLTPKWLIWAFRIWLSNLLTQLQTRA